jgi:hypothetical protein
MASSKQERFPLLGFPNETNIPAGEIVYQCWFGTTARVAIWQWQQHRTMREKGRYGVNLYVNHATDKLCTHVQDRYSYKQKPIAVNDAFEAQLAINYLIQTHLPQEVIDDISNAGERQDTNSAEEQQTGDVHSHGAAGEALE